jgi:hypothetical protein
VGQERGGANEGGEKTTVIPKVINTPGKLKDDIRDTKPDNKMTTVIPKVIISPYKLQDDIRDTKSDNIMTTVIPKVI